MLLSEIDCHQNLIKIYRDQEREVNSFVGLDSFLNYDVDDYEFEENNYALIDIDMDDYLKKLKSLSVDFPEVGSYVAVIESLAGDLKRKGVNPVIEVEQVNSSDVDYDEVYKSFYKLINKKLGKENAQLLSKGFNELLSGIREGRVKNDIESRNRFGNISYDDFLISFNKIKGLPEHIACYIEIRKDKLNNEQEKIIRRMFKSNSYAVLENSKSYIFAFDDKKNAESVFNKINSFLTPLLNSLNSAIHQIKTKDVLENNQRTNFFRKILSKIEMHKNSTYRARNVDKIEKFKP